MSDDEISQIKRQIRANERRMSDIESEQSAMKTRSRVQTKLLMRIDSQMQGIQSDVGSLKGDMEGMRGAINFGKWVAGLAVAIIGIAVTVLKSIR